MTATEPRSVGPTQMLEFVLGTEHYCVGIDEVDEIVGPGEITALPDTQPAIAGVMDLRGEMTTIVRPALLFDVATDDERKQVIILDGDDERFGWLVDSVQAVSERSDPERDPAADNQYVTGLFNDGEQFTIWVDVEAIHGSLSV